MSKIKILLISAIFLSTPGYIIENGSCSNFRENNNVHLELDEQLFTRVKNAFSENISKAKNIKWTKDNKWAQSITNLEYLTTLANNRNAHDAISNMYSKEVSDLSKNDASKWVSMVNGWHLHEALFNAINNSDTWSRKSWRDLFNEVHRKIKDKLHTSNQIIKYIRSIARDKLSSANSNEDVLKKFFEYNFDVWLNRFFVICNSPDNSVSSVIAKVFDIKSVAQQVQKINNTENSNRIPNNNLNKIEQNNYDRNNIAYEANLNPNPLDESDYNLFAENRNNEFSIFNTENKWEWDKNNSNYVLLGDNNNTENDEEQKINKNRNIKPNINQNIGNKQKGQELSEYQKELQKAISEITTNPSKQRVGLKNLEANCYLNALVQVFANQPAFLEELFKSVKDNYKDLLEKTNSKDKDTKNNANVTLEFVKLLANLWTTKPSNNQNSEKSCNPTNFLKALCNSSSLFKPEEPGDTKDLYVDLVERCRQTITKPVPNFNQNNILWLQIDQLKKQYYSNESSVLKDFFYLITETTSKCKKCNVLNTGHGITNFLSLGFDEMTTFKYNKLSNEDQRKQYIGSMYTPVSTYDILNKLECFEQIKDDWCNNCGKSVDKLTQERIACAPKVLCVCLSRDKEGLQGCSFKTPKFLDLKDYVNVDRDNAKYFLSAAICHIGEPGMQGHYITIARPASDQQFYMYNDSKVSKLTVNEVNAYLNHTGNKPPYMLFYTRMDADPLYKNNKDMETYKQWFKDICYTEKTDIDRVINDEIDKIVQQNKNQRNNFNMGNNNMPFGNNVQSKNQGQGQFQNQYGYLPNMGFNNFYLNANVPYYNNNQMNNNFVNGNYRNNQQNVKSNQNMQYFGNYSNSSNNNQQQNYKNSQNIKPANNNIVINKSEKQNGPIKKDVQNNKYTQFIPKKMGCYKNDKDLKDVVTTRGLANIGATCFMNATLQCLANTYPLVNYFLSPQQNKSSLQDGIAKDRSDESLLTPDFISLIYELWNASQPDLYFSPNGFRIKVEQMNPLFKIGSAGDSKDFIIFLLEQLHKELKKPVDNKNSINIDLSKPLNQYDRQETLNRFFLDFQKETSIISDHFFGVTETTTECSYCNRSHKLASYNYQIFNCLIFPLEEVRKMRDNNIYNNMYNVNYNNMYNVNNPVSIYDCFEYNQKQEFFTGGNKTYCNKCHKLQESIYTSKIFSEPNVLILILNRGKGNVYNVKLNFPQEIDISRYIWRDGSKDGKYFLSGVITHIGESGPNAHFVASTRNTPNDPWVRHNDSMTSIIGKKDNNFEKDILNFGTPYILFYQKLSLYN